MYKDTKSKLNNPPTSNANTLDDFTKSLTQAHEKAAYGKYALNSVIGINTLNTILICGVSVRKKREESEENAPPQNDLS